MFRFTSDAVPLRDRLDVLVDSVAKGLMPTRAEPSPGLSPNWAVEGRLVGELPIVSVSGSGYRVARTRSEIARTAETSYVATIHLDGATPFTSQGTERVLTPGNVFLLDSTQPFGLGLERPFRHLVVKLPRDLIESRLPRPELFAGGILPRDRPLTRLFAAYLMAGFQVGEALSPAASSLFLQHLVDLLAEALALSPPEGPPPSRAWQAAMYVNALRLIALRLGNPDLNPDAIAQALGISTRTLYRLFAAQGTTVMKHVIEERLKRAADLLRSPEARHRTVTEIAFACGFNDISHFGRVFAEHRGITPSEWRKQAL